ncbi:expressed unknown protein [Seminavis robusta]|uniref:Uncharacterized protein n=1 Tax=Seminavis robusta TaxID=568900 RepID=A0A9N8HAX4_9STRA|nr:expressed unknown protein [Seminavis robusta]|eukprot:Sro241_g096330.1 n/a (135) ;mRNA; r:38695-39099
MTGNGWQAAAKSVFLKSGTIGSVGMLGTYWGTKENLRMHADYPFVFLLTSATYGINYMAMRQDRSMAKDTTQPKFFRYMHTVMAFPRQVVTHPSVAIPIAFGVGFLFGKLTTTTKRQPWFYSDKAKKGEIATKE